MRKLVSQELTGKEIPEGKKKPVIIRTLFTTKRKEGVIPVSLAVYETTPKPGS